MISLLAPQPVSFFRSPAGNTLCRFNLVVANQGDEAATQVELEGTATTLAGPNSVSTTLLLQGPNVIPAGELGHYFFQLTIGRGVAMQYLLRMHNGGTSIDTIRAPAGIVCTE